MGFVFDGKVAPDGLCYCGVDFDACIESGKLQSLARSRIERLKTYTEGSVSRTGIHCIARAKPLDRIVKFDGVEIYTTARYFTFTGYSTGEIKAAPAEISALVEEVRAKEAAAKKQQGAAKQQQRPGPPNTHTGLINPAGFTKGPAKAFAGLGLDESLSDGIKTTPWFDALSPELKNEVVDYALGGSLRQVLRYLSLRRTVAITPSISS